MERPRDRKGLPPIRPNEFFLPEALLPFLTSGANLSPIWPQVLLSIGERVFRSIGDIRELVLVVEAMELTNNSMI